MKEDKMIFVMPNLTNILTIYSNGDIAVNGELTTDNDLIVDALKKFYVAYKGITLHEYPIMSQPQS